MKCLKCGYKWEPRVKEPKSCPKCHRHDWREPRKRWPKEKKDESG
jgi:predicted Zn-ribbon and HTH transcriptional regulator